MKNKKLVFWLFILISLSGLLLRLYFILTKNLFIDEVMYSEIPLKYHIIDIIKANHRIKDNGFLYYFYLKLFLLFTNNLHLLRLSNIPLYIISTYYIYRLFTFLKFKYLSLIPIFIYVFLTYFVYMNTMISTYNLTIFIAVITTYYLFQISLNNRKNNLSSYIFLLISLVAGFYTNYSFIYMIFLLIPLLVYIFVKNKKKILPVLIIFIFALILIVPGLILIIKNYQSVISINIPDAYKELRPYYFFCNLTDTIFLRKGHSLSMIILGLLVLYRVFWLFKKRYFNNISVMIITSLLLSFVFIYFVNNYISLIFFERAFWFIYLMIIFFITDLLKLLWQQKKRVITALLTIMLIVGIIFRFNNQYYQILLPGNVNDFTDYQQLIMSLLSERTKLNTKNLVLIDNDYKFYPILKYYLSDLYKNKGDFFNSIREYRKKVNIYKINNVYDLDNQTLKPDTTYVLFNPESQYITYLLTLTNNIRSTVYVFEDAENDNFFKKIYSFYD